MEAKKSALSRLQSVFLGTTILAGLALPGLAIAQQAAPAKAAADDEIVVTGYRASLRGEARYSGSTFPYYFGRSYVNYPHYEQWHEPHTDARRRERKMKFLNTFFEPLIDFTHGVQTDRDEPPKPDAEAVDK